MKHFTAEAWLDFARRTMSREEMALMQRHLDGGCRRCLQLYETWSAVSGIANREETYGPPERAVRLAKAAYEQSGPRRPVRRAVRMAQLIFDNSLNLAPAGVRTSTVPTRQVLHKAGPFLIDLRMESEAGRNRVFVVGQVLNSRAPSKEVKGVEVVLQREEHLVAQAIANPFGEFQLEFEREKDLKLFVDIPGRKTIGIVLPEPEA